MRCLAILFGLLLAAAPFTVHAQGTQYMKAVPATAAPAAPAKPAEKSAPAKDAKADPKADSKGK